MRGEDAGQVAAFSYISPEQRVPKDHPLRRLLKIVNNVLEQMSPLFAGMYSHTGRCLSTRMRRWSRVISEHSRGWQAC